MFTVRSVERVDPRKCIGTVAYASDVRRISLRGVKDVEAFRKTGTKNKRWAGSSGGNSLVYVPVVF
jgi:hypothetical protein